MSIGYRLTPRADRDLADLWEWIALNDRRAADGVIIRIERIFRMLAENPMAGRARPDLAEGLRAFPVGNLIVFYRPSTSRVDVIRVLEGRRNIVADDFT